MPIYAIRQQALIDGPAALHGLPRWKEFLTIKDLEASGYGSRTTIYREMREGNLPYIKTEMGRVLIPTAQFEDYLLERSRNARPQPQQVYLIQQP